VIRQAISCDICGAEKKQTNHWYITCEAAGELRVGGWNSRMRQRPNAKHLCGQICLHKVVDEFIARSSGQRAAAPAESPDTTAARADADASLTSSAAYEEVESSARLIASPVFAPPAAPVVPMQPRLVPEPAAIKALPPQIEETPNYSSRRWRADAWERERNRELRSIERHTRHKGL
jgi:hypothetical protein